MSVLLAPPTFKSNKTTGDRAFQVAAPFEWNKLPKSLRLEKDLRRNPIEDGAISGFSGQNSVPE